MARQAGPWLGRALIALALLGICGFALWQLHVDAISSADRTGRGATARDRILIAVIGLTLLPLLTAGLSMWWRAHRRSFRYQARMSEMIGHAPDPFIEFDIDGVLRTWSPQAEAAFGWPAEEVLGRHVHDFLLPPWRCADHERRLNQLRSGDWNGLHGRRESVVLSANGEERWVEVTSWPSVIRGQPRISSFLHDITGRRRLEAELRAAAENDGLTGLSNRRMFQQRLAEVCARLSRAGGAVAFLDLDDFKTVNDTYGHRMGDRLLQVTAARIREAIGSFPGAIAARFGGDEFAVLLPDATHAESRWLAASLVAKLHQTFLAEEREMLISASLGLVVLPVSRCRSEDVMRDADLAMYAAKGRGRNTWAEFQPEMYEAVSADTRLEAELRAALRDGGLQVHYQPAVALIDGSPLGVEALARWEHPELGSVPPSRFIPLAERRNLIGAVGSYVLHEACRQLAAWRAEPGGAAPQTVAVNVSVEQLADSTFPNLVGEALARAGLRPADLIIEVPERAAVQDDQGVTDSLYRLRDLGVRLAIDDFGTGHSSLAKLRELPVDALKIDRSLLDRVAEQGSDPMVSAIVTMAEGLRLEVTVVGIETPGQAEYVTWLGCRSGQGFLYAAPQPPDELIGWWRERAASAPRPAGVPRQRSGAGAEPSEPPSGRPGYR